LVFGTGITGTTVVSGSLGLTESGPGTLVLTGVNLYNGPTSVTGGTLEVGNGGATGQLGSVGPVSISTGANLTYNLSSITTLGFAISGGGSFSQIGSGTTVLNGNNSYGGGTNIGTGSTLKIGAVTGLPIGSTISNNGHFQVAAGTSGTPVISGNISGTGDVTVGVGASKGYLTLGNNTHTSTVSAVTVNAGSTLDIGNNTLKVSFGGAADPVATIASEIANGYNGGAWTGTSAVAGVITSTPAQTQGGPALAVGYYDGNTDTDVAGSNPAGPSAIAIKYTLSGDANLDGLVNFNDLVTVVQNFNKGGTDWAHGNFQFGTSTNFNDLVAVVQNFNKNLTPAGSQGDGLGGGGTIGLSATVQVQNTAVQLPEPASFTLLGAGAAGLLARRRRKAGK
jgi:autotransporter-associated beta strand protein